jgi:hypothetical protein
MAVGDAAGAKGLVTYSDALLVKNVDDALNQRGDELAAAMGRVDTLEAARTSQMSGGVMRRSEVPVTIGSGSWNILDTATWWSVEQPAVGDVTFDGSWVINADGLYDVSAALQVDAAVNLLFGVKLNNREGANGSGLIVSNTGAGTAGLTSSYVSRRFRLRKGDRLRAVAFVSANAAWTTYNRDTSFFSVRYVEALR